MRATGLLLWVCITALACGSHFPPSYIESLGKFGPETPLNFTQGLAAGLEVDQESAGPCLGAVGQVLTFISSVENDIAEMIHGKGNAGLLGIHISELVTAIVNSVPPCQYQSIIPDFQQLTWQQMLSNSVSHLTVLDSNIRNLSTCKSNAYTCGLSIGKICRYVFAWGVYAPAPPSGTFLSGLLEGLETSPNGADKCMEDLTSLGGEFTKTENDLKSLISGDIPAAFAVYSDLKSLLSSLSSDSSDCNFPQLLTTLDHFLTPSGLSQLISNIKSNRSEILQASAGLLHCSSNYASCGYSTGEVLRLVLDWGI